MERPLLRICAPPACISVYVSEELLVEILKRLPAKSLLRFMLVCKSWCSLIKSPIFISTHFDHQMNEGLKCLLYRKIDDFYVHKDDDSCDRYLTFTCPGMFRDVGCCNGIVCFSVYEDETSFVLWNSAIRKSMDVKVPHGHFRNGDKTASWFGFDPRINDYKLVWFVYLTRESWETRPLVVYVYSLNERTWRCFSSSLELYDVYLIQVKGVCLNGVVHWVAESYYDESDGDFPMSMLTFNLTDETFGEMALPSEIVSWKGCRFNILVVKRGSKNCLAAIYDNSLNKNFWVLEEEGLAASWIKVFRVNRNDLIIKKILNVRMNGEIMIETPDGVVSWDRLLRKMKFISREKMYYVGTYVENLLLL